MILKFSNLKIYIKIVKNLNINEPLFAIYTL